ncbi:hypothetical protein DQ384_10775 [Sphaerisporangium album]|uniref:Uncharacterized protein n=1 Tax=Sphaerisporangium album TaxID=509200 RepID=A0A367FLD7_9ACTN|nr:hypothetical protein DQ384_10775 [Sphaerisporangium album]
MTRAGRIREIALSAAVGRVRLSRDWWTRGLRGSGPAGTGVRGLVLREKCSRERGRWGALGLWLGLALRWGQECRSVRPWGL